LDLSAFILSPDEPGGTLCAESIVEVSGTIVHFLIFVDGETLIGFQIEPTDTLQTDILGEVLSALGNAGGEGHALESVSGNEIFIFTRLASVGIVDVGETSLEGVDSLGAGAVGVEEVEGLALGAEESRLVEESLLVILGTIFNSQKSLAGILEVESLFVQIQEVLI